ncbi:MAG: hypothetical protein ACR2OU_08035 [Thermomicrobiales bacterium]
MIKGAYLSAKGGQWATLPENPTGTPVVRTTAAVTPFSADVPDAIIH